MTVTERMNKPRAAPAAAPLDLVLPIDAPTGRAFRDAPPTPRPTAAIPPAKAPGVPTPETNESPALPSRRERSSMQLPALFAMLAALGGAGLVAALSIGVGMATRDGARLRTASDALVQSQRLMLSSREAKLGVASAFADVRESAHAVADDVRALVSGSADVAALDGDTRAAAEALLPAAERLERSGAAIQQQQKTLAAAGQLLGGLVSRSAEWLQAADSLPTFRAANGSGAVDAGTASAVAVAAQRVAYRADSYRRPEGFGPEDAAQLERDLHSLHDGFQGVAASSRDVALRARLDPLVSELQADSANGSLLAPAVAPLQAARAAQAAIVADGEPMRRGLEALQARLAGERGSAAMPLLLLGASLLAIAGGVYGLLRSASAGAAARARAAEARLAEAERQERELTRTNAANQSAILRLMDELQNVAAGDLTQQATVTEDITGAIADSVNYTVEELRSLVTQVQGTAARVAETTERVDETSTELLAASSEQLREIRDTGESVLQMAERINDVSSRAQRTAEVARESLQASESGLVAVQDAIEGMNAIRDQIQDTSKRIKRLGESSQEIGEITELISDITEQTNVLALNAAIQAASAGEAGRGFSVVAEEVQRLAERSADATRQIAALVKATQTDTQDAVAAMERSTQGVVEGARLSDAAGTALVGIDRVTRELSNLILRISDQASREAASANVVAVNIQHIFAVTEQAGDGTRSTAQMVRELSHIAEELRESVARFKIA